MNAISAAHQFRSVNPVTGTAIASFASIGAVELEEKLAAAAAAQAAWAASAVGTRAAVLRAIAATLRAERAELGRIATLEMGKLYAAAMAECDKSAMTCDYYAEHGAEIMQPTPVAMPSGSAEVRVLPLGVILAIMPWNFPIWQAMRFIAPAIMAGNGILLKHAANVPQCALMLERLVRQAGIPAGMPAALFTNLFVDTDLIPGIIADDRVAGVTLTGSERAGIAVGQAAGQALKKCVLELGGSDPFIVMPSADLDSTVRTAVNARMHNNGQSCVCAKRFIVHAAVYDRFEAAFVRIAAAMVVGDPMQPETEMGPLCTEAARRALEAQMDRALTAGARVLTGGSMLDGPGYFFPPTVLAGVPHDAAIAREEFFGPVAMLFKVSSKEEALALANDVPFGLGSSVWTQDAAEAEFFVAGIAAGMTAVNTMVISDPRVPFGGVKKSGYGRELAAIGLREFCNIKTVLRA
jgi:succinate-semialdehyde dehydrogenase/glutarate-semialdehyde dehydrogenase